MGLLVDGIWQDKWYETRSTKGEFVRDQSRFRSWITRDGAPGPTGQGGFVAEADRYHLYVSLACPWAHRTLIFRALKGLEDLISVSIVDPYMPSDGWFFSEPEPLFGADKLHQLYTRAAPDYSGRVTVPVLWDKTTKTIVSNESSEIIRMFNSAFDGLTGNDLDLWPEHLRGEIEEVNALVYDNINNGVYRAGFATTQEAYERAFDHLFESLDTLDTRLSTQRYLLGSCPTEADVRLFTTLVRFDPVYVGHFKCNKKRLIDYPNLWSYTRELFSWPGVSQTVRFDHIKTHYYGSHESINPTGIVPKGPDIDFTVPHDRERLVGQNLADCRCLS